MEEKVPKFAVITFLIADEYFYFINASAAVRAQTESCSLLIIV